MNRSQPTTVLRHYRKGPIKFALMQAYRLRRLSLLSLVLGALFIALSNPFATWDAFWRLPENLRQGRVMLTALPEFARVFPQELEQQSFAVFDEVKVQFEQGWPIFARDTLSEDKEAGQSATPAKAKAVDYASLPFYLEIPKFALRQPVAANVNPNNAKEYQPALEQGVAHARGSAFPPEQRLVYIFGHSTDGLWNVEAYNAVFYQIKDLVVGDEVIAHLGEDRFVYRVSQIDIVRSSEVDFVNDRRDDNLLLLQTCWPPGTTWQRLFVTAEPVL